MGAVAFDTLKFVKRLEASGISASQAEATAEAFSEAIVQDLVTKGDLAQLGQQVNGLEQKIVQLEQKMDHRFDDAEQRMDRRFIDAEQKTDHRFSDFEQRMDRRFIDIEQKTDHRFSDFEQRMDRRFDDIDHRFIQLEQKMTIKLGGLLVIAVGVIVTLQHLWH